MRECSRILVTGGAGFIGSHLVDRLLAEDLEVVVLDNLQKGRFDNVSKHAGRKDFRFIRGDIRDFHTVKDLIKDVDAVLHCAAVASVPESITDPLLTSDINVNGTLTLLHASVAANIKYFIFASSAAIYGDVKVLPIRETCPQKPLSPYGVSKLAAENYVRVFHEIFGLRTVCLRYFNVYGPRQVFSDYSGVITQFINQLTKNLPLKVYGDGEQTRDFTYVKDVVEANILVLGNRGISGETFNIASGVATKINQLGCLLLEIANKARLGLRNLESKKGEIKHSVADISKAERTLCYHPKFSLRNGLEETFNAFATNELLHR